jgi:DNA-binding MarR family transcriptional regulator
MTEKDSALDAFLRIGFSLQRLNRLAERDYGLSLAQWSVLRLLVDRPGISPGTLAERAGIHPSSLSQALARLARRKFVFVARDPLDARRKQLFVTREGKASLDRVARVASAWSEELAPLAGAISAVRGRAEKMTKALSRR